MFKNDAIVDSHCERFSIELTNIDALAKSIAHVLVQQYELAKKYISNETRTENLVLNSQDVENIIDRRLHKTLKYHRDGFLFQLIMWVSSHTDLSQSDLVALPHAQPSQKGQDSIIIHRSRDAVYALSICEDKATENPRATIRDEVWLDFKDYEGGGRDDELRSGIISCLGTAGVPHAEAIRLIQNISWNGKRRYRARVTIETKKRKNGLFKGFSDIPSKGKACCRGETVYIANLRTWMDDFSSKVEAELRSLAAADV